MKKNGFLLVLFLFLFPGVSYSAPSVREQAPGPLREWIPWVLHGHEEMLSCTAPHNDPEVHLCAWPSVLRLAVASGSASFSQEWVFLSDGWVSLPGSSETWPREVLVDQKPATVADRGGSPVVWIEAGRHAVSGQFTWETLPESLQLPKETALIDLSVNGRTVEFPQRDTDGRLWLRRGEVREVKEEDRLSLRVFRLVEDSVPLTIVFQMDMEVSGADREVVLGKPLNGMPLIPLSLSGQVPARLAPDGELRAQVRPGHWTITLAARHEGPAAALPFVQQPSPWPAEEVWAFQAHSELRVVEVEGVSPIDPRQTVMPAAWRGFPAYRLTAGEVMQLKESKRGDPDPGQDQLSLQRKLWLRFDGSGYTVSDTITGRKYSDWRLEMGSGGKLGRVAVDGVDRFITRLPGSGREGVELRRGEVQMTADSEIAATGSLSATGWAAGFSSAAGILHLPPGWRIVAASGVDRIDTTWWDSWTLLDFFLTLILSLAAARLWGRPFGLLFAATLILNYHEHGAPLWVWPVLLAAVALSRVLPEGLFLRLVRLVRFAACLVLIGVTLPYAIAQVRQGVYPQLERPWQMVGLTDSMLELAGQQMKMADEMRRVETLAVPSAPAPYSMTESGMGAAVRHKAAEPQRLAQYDPKMVNQTGPGLPTWSWRQVSFGWSGPVHENQEIRFFLLGPGVNLALAFLRVLLLAAAIAGVAGVRLGKGAGLSLPPWKSILTTTLLAWVLLLPSMTRAGDFPPKDLLDALRERLLEREPCFPECAAIQEMTVSASDDSLSLGFSVDVLAGKVAVPLPGAPSEWTPSVVTVNGKAVTGLVLMSNSLWAPLEKGRHRLEMTGRIPDRKSFQLAFPLKPHRAVLRVEGWTVDGIRENGRMDNQLQFTRERQAEFLPEGKGEAFETVALPPYVQVERHLLLDLKWRMVTTVTRLSPPGEAVVLAVPLVPGESVITEGVRTEGGKVQVILDQRASSFRWESGLDMQPSITLTHAPTGDWTEVWRVSASPVWHLEHKGIPVILHQDGGEWAPVWHPWPGETVELAVTKPEGVEGRTMTIDRSALSVRPGNRSSEAELTIAIRSSQGGQHPVRLPEGAELQSVNLDGRPLSIRQEGRTVTLPLAPGKQSFAIAWRETSGMSSRYHLPAVDLGTGSVNTEYELKAPENRWLLFVWGPRLGPAVLFYSFLFVLALASFALARLDMTPLAFHHWFLLGIGLSQASVVAVVIVAGWILALGWRRKIPEDMPRGAFNALQAGLAVLTLAALVTLVISVSQGLLGQPDMQIRGNGSSGWILRWYQDRSGPQLPDAWVLSVPMLAYRAAMLAWALWTAFAVLGILKWGWTCFSGGGAIWKRKPKPPEGEGPPEIPVMKVR